MIIHEGISMPWEH